MCPRELGQIRRQLLVHVRSRYPECKQHRCLSVDACYTPCDPAAPWNIIQPLKSETLILATMWMSPENIMLIEGNQTQKDKYYKSACVRVCVCACVRSVAQSCLTLWPYEL